MTPLKTLMAMFDAPAAGDDDACPGCVSDNALTHDLGRKPLAGSHRGHDILTRTHNGHAVATDIAAELHPIRGLLPALPPNVRQTLRVVLDEIARHQHAEVITINRICLICRHYNPRPPERGPVACSSTLRWPT